jgi:glycerol-3-phosphate cytidylyltransferase-like family protein
MVKKPTDDDPDGLIFHLSHVDRLYVLRAPSTVDRYVPSVPSDLSLLRVNKHLSHVDRLYVLRAPSTVDRYVPSVPSDLSLLRVNKHLSHVDRLYVLRAPSTVDRYVPSVPSDLSLLRVNKHKMCILVSFPLLQFLPKCCWICRSLE